MSTDAAAERPPKRLRQAAGGHDVVAPFARATERDVGMSEFVHPAWRPVHGIIKQRYSDFIVHELAHAAAGDGIDVVRITSLGPPRGDGRGGAGEGGKSGGGAQPDASALQAASEEAPNAERETARAASSWDDLLVYFEPGAVSVMQSWANATSPASAAPPANASTSANPSPPHTTATPTAVTSMPVPEKAERTRVHALVRELTRGVVQSEATTLADGAAAVQASPMRDGPRRGSSQRPRHEATSEAHSAAPYIHFTLQKTNRDSQEALHWLARFLRLDVGRGRGGRKSHAASTNQLSVAGTKDKRAVTVQRIALQRGRRTLMDVWRSVNHIGQPVSSGDPQGGRRSIAHAMETRAERGLRIAHLCYADAPLQLGMLAGNQFTIVLRDVHWADERTSVAPSDRRVLIETLHERARLVEEDGFVNYFGMQRFGTGAVPTHRLGIAVLRGDFAEALRLILGPPGGDDAQDATPGADGPLDSPSSLPPGVAAVRAARQALAEERYDDAYRHFPKTCVAERAVLERMRTAAWQPSDPLGAFQNVRARARIADEQIPRSLRLMYVHAYQSYLWNRLVSERVRRFGARAPVVGDMVEVAGEASPHILTDADVGSCSMDDVVMPMPGTEVALPDDGWLAELYRALLAVDGLTPASLGTSRQPEYRLKGAYRKIIQKPRAFTAEVLAYSDPDVPLAYTDEECLLGGAYVGDDAGDAQGGGHRGGATSAEEALANPRGTGSSRHFRVVRGADAEDAASLGGVESKDASQDMDRAQGTEVSPRDAWRNDAGPGATPTPPLLALRVTFQLPPSSYATILLREILRTDTSAHAHRALTIAGRGIQGDAGAAGETGAHVAPVGRGEDGESVGKEGDGGSYCSTRTLDN
ncbi:tRNA pseudouridine(13) synthase [Malassezia sp. CBS 17886]|nr:tRNA pseudouridine(13) synthase [Malassezia sp. CBS 17886]